MIKKSSTPKKQGRSNSDSENWDFEAEQNWVGFWNLILKEHLRQNLTKNNKKIKKQKHEK